MNKKIWIQFVQHYPKINAKTKYWKIFPINYIPTNDQLDDEGFVLGKIYWYSGFRKYVFNGYSTAVFEEDCLRVIADFCEQQTKLHKENKKNVKKALV
jgi:hypothetical protein